MKTSGIPLIIALVLLVRCGGIEDAPAMRKARETSAFAELKKFSTAQNIMYTEYGHFARDLEELETLGGGLIERGMVQASHRAPSPKPLNGFFFSEIEPRASMQAGLAAYPEKVGKTGDKVIMILIDPGRGPGPSEEHPISGDNARIFFAQAKEINLPFTHWPSETELSRNWKEIRRRTPEEGLREARQIVEDFKSGRPPQEDPVFGK